MQLAEVCKHDLGAEPQRAGSAGVEPRRRVACDLSFGRVEAEALQQAHRVRLDLEQIGVGDLAVPMPASAREPRCTRAHARRRDQLIGRLVAAIGLADLEQRHIGEAAIAVALHRREQTRQQARPHRRHLGRDGIGEDQRFRAAAEMLGLTLLDERPRDRLDETTCGQRAAGAAHAFLPLGQRRARNATIETRQRR